VKGTGLISALVRITLAGALVALGARAYQGLSAPDPGALGRLAERELASIFGSEAETRRFVVDLIEGVTVEELSVPSSSGVGDGLSARRVTVRHALLDLVSGLYRPRSLDVAGARIRMRETASGAALDFPFKLGRKGGEGTVPEIRIEDAEITIAGRPGSERLAEGAALRIVDLQGSALKSSDGRLSLRGSFRTAGLGQDEVRIDIGGAADPRGDALDVLVVWDPLRITPELLATLAPDLAETLRELPVAAGRVEAHLLREGGAGELRVTPRWIGAMTSDVGELPGLKELAPEDKERLRDLLGGGVLDVAVERGRLVLRSLTTRLGEARITASGWIAPDGEELAIEAIVEDLSLEDPALRRALGAAGEEIAAKMTVRGRANARLTIARARGGSLTWGADVELNDLEFTYHGGVDAQGVRDGFPYRLEGGKGRLHVGPEGVRIDGIEGRHGERTVLRVLPSTRPSWQGEETGYVRFGPDGAELRITVEAFDMAVDADLEAAVAGSEFAGLLERYQLEGVIDRVELDLMRRPGLDDVVRSEVRVTLDDERFRWQRLPIQLEGVRGVVTLRRPPLAADDPVALATGSRVGRTFYVDARASVAGSEGASPVTLHAEVDAARELGRLHVKGTNLDLAGPLREAVRTAPLTADGMAELWAWLSPTGRADLEADFPLEEDPAPHRILVRLKDVDVVLDASQGARALKIDDLRGVIRAVGDDIRTHGIEGVLLGSPLELSGAWPEGGDGPFTVDLVTRTPIPLTSGFLEAVQTLAACTTLFPYGLELEPGGQAALDLTIVKTPDSDCPELPRLMLRDVDVGLRWPGGPLLGLSGAMLVFEEGEVSAESLTITLPGLIARVADARHGPGGLRGRFDFALDGFRMDEELLSILPESTASFLGDLTLDRQLSSPGFTLVLERDGSARLGGELMFLARPGAPAGGAPRGRLTLEAVELGPDDGTSPQSLRGAAVFDGLSIDPGVRLTELKGRVELAQGVLGETMTVIGRASGLEGRLEGVRFEGLDAAVRWEQGVLVADPITASFSGGRLDATLRVHTEAPEAYQGRIVVTDFDVGRLKDDLSPTGPPLAGRGTLRVDFENRSGKAVDLTAAGRLDVRDGRLGELPAVANLFIALEELLPGDAQPAFETLAADFTLRDEVICFRRIDLAGPLTTMPGRGQIDLSGQLDLVFQPDFIKSMLLPAFVPLPVIGDLLKVLLPEEIFYAVRVHGDMGDPRIDVIGFPWLGMGRSARYETPPAPPAPRRPLPSSFR
jgi:hypothetical protein